MENVERGPNDIKHANLQRKQTVFNEKFIIQHGGKKTKFQDSKKSAYFLNLKLNSIRSFPHIFFKVLVNAVTSFSPSQCNFGHSKFGNFD